jgi:hypothetical protein
MMARSRRLAVTLPAQILAALDEQTVVVPATEQYGRVIGGVAAQLLAVLDQRVTVAGDLNALLADHPLAEVLTSMPGVGARTAVALLLTLGDGSTFATAGHLAAYAGTGPGDPPVRSEHPGREPTAAREPGAEERLVLVGFRQSEGPDQPGLLRPQARRRQESPGRPALPRPPPYRRLNRPGESGHVDVPLLVTVPYEAHAI